MTYFRKGFTLIEVLACVLVLSLGLTAAAGLMVYGLNLVRSSHGRTIGLATAMTVLADPSPLRTDVSLTPTAPTDTGYLNGLWVVRTESDEISLGGNDASVLVSVDVYDGNGGECYASVTRRLLKKN